MSKAEKWSPRRMEFLQYTSKDNPLGTKKKKKKRNDGLGWHYDTESMVTLVIMCSKKGAYTGGKFEIKTRQKGVEHIPVDLGDVLVFVSEKTEHRVSPILGGERCTFVFEVCFSFLFVFLPAS